MDCLQKLPCLTHYYFVLICTIVNSDGGPWPCSRILGDFTTTRGQEAEDDSGWMEVRSFKVERRKHA